MEHSTEIFVGIDVSKLRNAIAVADGERGGEVRYLGGSHGLNSRRPCSALPRRG